MCSVPVTFGGGSMMQYAGRPRRREAPEDSQRS
jgi:hypothetical protein